MMTASAPATRTRPGWPAIAVSAVAALFYAYAVWNAVGNLIQAAEIGLNATGWVVWVFAALFPVAVFVLAAGMAIRWALWKYAVVHLVGLSVVAVFWFNVVAYSTMYTANLIA